MAARSKGAPRSKVVNSQLEAAITEFGNWARAAGPLFWPKEETLQGWFCAALAMTGYAKHPTEIVQEMHFGEVKDSDTAYPIPPEIRVSLGKTKTRGRRHGRFDIAVLPESA